MNWDKFAHSCIVLLLLSLYVFNAKCKDNLPKENTKSVNSIKANEKSGIKERVNSTSVSAYSAATPLPILPEWGGNCTKKHWDKCSRLERLCVYRRWVTSYPIDRKKPELGYKLHETDCKVQPILCLTNGWTVTKCQLLCMRCNKEFITKYDKYVVKEGAC